MNEVKKKIGAGLITSVVIGLFIAILTTEPVAQDLDYHNFSDTNGFLYLPNAWNVLSNVPFVVVGIAGLLALSHKRKHPLVIANENRHAYLLLFWGTILVGLGSAYYHLNPTNQTLVWDRIPITIAFMGLYAIVISEFVSLKLGRLSLFPLIILGICSVLYWSITERSGSGDLRFYAVVQLLPILTMPIMLICYKPMFTLTGGYWVLIALYIGAKLVETFDYEIHSLLGVISGHSLKHLLPAIGLYYLLSTFKNRVAT